jgi:hypothetical protein
MIAVNWEKTNWINEFHVDKLFILEETNMKNVESIPKILNVTYKDRKSEITMRYTRDDPKFPSKYMTS